MSWKWTIPLCLVIAILTIVAVNIIYATEPKAKRSGVAKKTAMLVETITPSQGDFAPRIVALGQVIAARHLTLRPRVGGAVSKRHHHLVPGAVVKAGSVLVELDSADFDLAIDQQRSAVAQAEAELLIERGRQFVAAQDYAVFAEELEREKQALALREPQLAIAEAAVRLARSNLEQAQLEKQRTHIVAPFDALILSREIEIGSQVSAGDALAELVAIDQYWVEVSVPLRTLPLITIPDDDQQGAAVTLRNRHAWPEGEQRTGFVFRLRGELNQQTRMARLLIAVPDPLARQDKDDAYPLIIGEYLQAEITGATLPSVIRLPRQYIRKNDTVWTMRDGKLAIRAVTIAFSDQHYAYISDGLAADAQVVRTKLSRVVEGSPLRLSVENDTASLPTSVTHSNDGK